MKDALLMNYMVSTYNKHAYAHQYIFGFVDRKMVYACFADASLLPYIATLDTASRGAGHSIRFKPNKSQKELLKQGECFAVCSEDFFKAEVKNSIYNNGEIFEKMVTEHFGQTWVKDHVPFTDAGDIEVNGTAYQIKFNKASFASEKQLATLEARS